MSDNIKVAIKVRPLINREITDQLPIQWMVHGNSIMPTDPELKKRVNTLHFDHVFDMDRGNIDLFEVMTKPIIDAAINGFNGTILTYGQTSSGKTYSMMGSDDNPGVIPLAINYIFETIDKTDSKEFLLKVTYLEIYNERINDLLDKNRLDLRIKENTMTKQVIVAGCTEHVCNTPEQVLQIMKSGDNIRTTDQTDLNEKSSRSHGIFRIIIESRESNACESPAVHISQLNFVDLAGSEKARQTGATSKRFNEGKYINSSLSTLGLVIMQLSEREEKRSKFINFRDSKLTRILQNSLGGNAMTAIICAVTPAAVEETQRTLAFASRAKKIKNEPRVNEVQSDGALLKRYRDKITELEKLKSTDDGKMELELIESKRTIQILLERIALLEKKIVSGNSSSEAGSVISKTDRRRTWSDGRSLTSKSSPPINRGLPTIETIERTPEEEEKEEEIEHRQNILEEIDINDQICSELSSPGTPKSWRNKKQSSALREDNTYLEDFSELEEQMFVEETVELAMAEDEKALAASEQKYQEINEKSTTPKKDESDSMENLSSSSYPESPVTQETEWRNNYESLLQEKNRIALELEEKKTSYLQLEKKHEQSTKERDEIRHKLEQLEVRHATTEEEASTPNLTADKTAYRSKSPNYLRVEEHRYKCRVCDFVSNYSYNVTRHLRRSKSPRHLSYLISVSESDAS